MLWASGNLRRFDQTIVAFRGVNTDGRIVVQFYRRTWRMSWHSWKWRMPERTGRPVSSRFNRRCSAYADKGPDSNTTWSVSDIAPYHLDQRAQPIAKGSGNDGRTVHRSPGTTGLLDKSVLDELRRKVAKAKGKKITPEAIARYLVDGGHLTRFQATRLISETNKMAAEAARDPQESVSAGEPPAAPDDRAESRKTPGVPATRRGSLPVDNVARSCCASCPVQWSSIQRRPRKTCGGPGPVDPLASLADEQTLGERQRSIHASRSARCAGADPWNAKLPWIGGISLGIILVIGAFLYVSLSRRAAEKAVGRGGVHVSRPAVCAGDSTVRRVRSLLSA